jgi:hypothetical protein
MRNGGFNKRQQDLQPFDSSSPILCVQYTASLAHTRLPSPEASNVPLPRVEPTQLTLDGLVR